MEGGLTILVLANIAYLTSNYKGMIGSKARTLNRNECSTTRATFRRTAGGKGGRITTSKCRKLKVACCRRRRCSGTLRTFRATLSRKTRRARRLCGLATIYTVGARSCTGTLRYFRTKVTLTRDGAKSSGAGTSATLLRRVRCGIVIYCRRRTS